MLTIYNAESMVDAQLVCDMLLSCGIDAVVTGGYLSGAAGELPVSSLIAVQISDITHRARARQIVKEMEVQRNEPVHSTVCAACGADSSSNFTLCWKCGLSLRND